MLAFFVVVAIVVWLPIHTFDPPPSPDWTPLASTAVKGRALFAQNGCYVCHSGYSRPQDVREGLYFLYPKVSEPGDFWGSDQSPNLLGTERTGPDLSQESGWHPDDWQRAHFYDPRFVDPMSLMPNMKSLFSDTQVDQLISFVQQRSGKSGLFALRGPAVREARGAREPGLPGALRPASRVRTVRSSSPRTRHFVRRRPSSKRPRTCRRSTAATGSRATRFQSTPQNLLRGKEVFLQRCVGCHGLKGDGKGPAATFMSPLRRTSRARTTPAAAGTTGPGDFYYRILRGWPGTAMENFGDRLSVDDIWRVVLFVKTIPNGTLAPNRFPMPSDYIVWQPSKELLAWVKTHQTLSGNASFDKKQVTDPFMQESMLVFPGLAQRDSMMLNDGTTQLSLQTAAAGIRALYEDMLNRAWNDARARGERLPPTVQKDLPPTVPGQQ